MIFGISLPFSSNAKRLFAASCFRRGFSSFGMRTSGSRLSSMLLTCRFENMIDEMMSGSLERSMRGEIESSVAMRQMRVMRFTISSSIASNSASEAILPFTIFAL